LVAQPNERIHALVLAGDGDAPMSESSAGEALDPAALRAYRARLSELKEELENAASRGQAGRTEGLRREKEFLEDELARSVGLGGRVRKLGSLTERARVNVTRRIKDALLRIAE